MSYKQYESKIIEYRRHLHQHPEVSFKEYKTAQYIRSILGQLEHCKVIEITETSTVGVFNKGRGYKLGLRADIDALPIHEERDDIEFTSNNDGVMHACGHDGHTALLLGAAHYFNDHVDQLNHEVHCIFQHAEELIPGGAREMVATGYFDDFDFIYGHHLWSQLDAGLIDIKNGPASANSDMYEITIQGKGGHSSTPHVTIDPLMIGTQFVNNIQTIISRQIDAHNTAVISNTLFKAGNEGALNVIPDNVKLGGTVRTQDKESRMLIKEQIEKHLDHLCDIYNATYTLDYTLGYDAVINDDQQTEYVRQIAQKMYPESVVNELPMLGGEDFSAFSNIVPSCYAFIGFGQDEGEYRYQHHHPKFGLNEQCFEKAFNMFIGVIEGYPEQK